MIHSLAADVLAAWPRFPWPGSGWLETPTPFPTPGFTGDANTISPGIVGFVVTFFVAAVTILLIVDMTRRIRRVRYRDEVRAKLETERLDAAFAAEQPDAGRDSDESDPSRQPGLTAPEDSPPR